MSDGGAEHATARNGTNGGERLWLFLALLLGLSACLGFLAMAFRHPGGVGDDARMFLSWMGRWSDPALLRGDLVADYWQSVTPWVFRGLFRAASAIGVAPLVFAKILPALLYLPVAFFAFRFLRAMEAGPFVAFLATAAVLFFFTRDGTVVSATPRALWPALLLAVLDGLARGRTAQTAFAQLLLSGSYPQLALVSATTIGLTLVGARRPFRLDLSRRRLLLVGACAAATAAGILPFLLDSGRFDPVVTLAEARAMPTFGPDGRNRIFKEDGSLDLLCGARSGVFGTKCKSAASPRVPVLVLLVLAGPVLLWVRAGRAAEAKAKAGLRSALPLLLLCASLAWFALSATLLFRLHLPSRYTAALPLLVLLATLPPLLEGIGGIAARLSLAGRPGWTRAGAVVLVLVAALGVGKARSVIRRPADPDLVAFLRATPPGTVVAGFAGDLDFSPVLTDRSTLFSRELAIGYHLGYFRPILSRMEDLRDAMLTHDPLVLADRLRRNGVTLLLVPEDVLAHPRIPAPFRGFFGAAALDALEAQAGTAPTALRWAAERCTLRRFGAVRALSAACLTAGPPAAPEAGR